MRVGSWCWAGALLVVACWLPLTADAAGLDPGAGAPAPRLRADWRLGADQGYGRGDPVPLCGRAMGVPTPAGTTDETNATEFWGGYLDVERSATERYQLVQALGNGTHGMVALARDLRNGGELVAIKKARIREIAKEAGLLHALQGSGDIPRLKNVLRPHRPEAVREEGSDGEFPHGFMVMERLAVPLREAYRLWGNNSAAMPPEAMRRMLFDIVRGLHYMHTNHLVHLDFSPKNIMVAPDCGVRIIDLGNARNLRQQRHDNRFIAFRLRHGSHPPEHLFRDVAELWKTTHGPKMAIAADLWGLGRVLLAGLVGGEERDLYAAAAGKRYKRYKNAKLDYVDWLGDMLGPPNPSSAGMKALYRSKVREIMERKLGEPRYGLEQAFPDVDPAALRLVRRLLAYEPTERPSTAEVLMDPYFEPVRSAASHRPALSEGLRADPHILRLVQEKGVGRHDKDIGDQEGIAILDELSRLYESQQER